MCNDDSETHCKMISHQKTIYVQAVVFSKADKLFTISYEDLKIRIEESFKVSYCCLTQADVIPFYAQCLANVPPFTLFSPVND